MFGCVSVAYVASDASGSDVQQLSSGQHTLFSLVRNEVWTAGLDSMFTTSQHDANAALLTSRRGQSYRERERTRIRFYRAPLFPPVNIFTLELVFSSLSWPRVCYSVLCVCDGRQPAADCSEITEMVKAAEGAWTSCWAQLKVMYRTRLVVTRHDRYPSKNAEYHSGRGAFDLFKACFLAA